MSVPAVRCARCVARMCGHPQCKPGGRTELKITDVAGTSCCADCAPVLLERVLHPAGRVPPPVIGGMELS